MKVNENWIQALHSARTYFEKHKIEVHLIGDTRGLIWILYALIIAIIAGGAWAIIEVPVRSVISAIWVWF